MNKEEIIARPYEEYYEMIKDMSKDNMIQGLYDLSKECIEKQNYINQLETNRDEAIEYIQKHFEEEYKKPREELKKYNLKNCTYDSGLVVLGILERGNNENS